MALVRVFQNPDGSVRILRLARAGISLDDAAAKDPSLAGLAFVDVDDATLPTSRALRAAWRVDLAGPQAVIVHLPSARAVRLAVLREERNRRLGASDMQMLRRLEPGAPQPGVNEWKAYRQALRDFPVVLESDLATLTTAEAIETYLPPWPPEPTV